MSNSLSDVKKHIDDLISEDKNVRTTIDSYYKDALDVVKNNIQAFFIQYASDNQLNAKNLAGDVNNWDLNRFKQAIKQLTTNIDDDMITDDYDKRMAIAELRAKLSKTNLIDGIISSGMAVATLLTLNYSKKHIQDEYEQEYSFISSGKKTKIPNDIIDNDFDKKVWNNNDLSSVRVTNTVNDNINKGLDSNGLKSLTKNNNGKKLANNIDSSSQAGISFTKNSVWQTSINANNKADFEFYHTFKNVAFLKWLTQEDKKVCKYCKGFESNVYTVDKAPIPQRDTHGGCRCKLLLCDKYGKLI